MGVKNNNEIINIKRKEVNPYFLYFQIGFFKNINEIQNLNT